MKSLILYTLALLPFLSQATLIHWEELSSSYVGKAKPSTIRDLLEVAVGYVIQQGKFESTKAPFPGDSYSTDYDSIKYERKNTSTVIYYKYNFLLEQGDGPATVNATAIVSYDPSNSNFVVTNYRYHINYNENQEQSDDGDESSPTGRVVVDTRSLTGDRDKAPLLSDSFDEIIAGHIGRGTLPDDTYTIHYVYRAESNESDGDEGNEGSLYYHIWLKMRSSEEKYYLMEVIIDIPKENGELVPDDARLVGSILLSDLNQQ